MNLFKRNLADPRAPYYTRFMVMGRRYVWCTQACDRRTALARAREYRQNVVDKRFDVVDSLKARQRGRHPMRALWAVYDDVARMIKPSTRRKNWLALLWITDLDTDRFVNEMKSIKRPDPGMTQSQLRTYNSRLRQAKSVFAKDYIDAYASLALPKMDFLLKARFAKVKTQKWRAPPVDTINALREGLAELQQQADPLGIVIVLGLYAGMRSDEIVNARWDWITEHGIRVEPDRDWQPKGDSRIIPIGLHVLACLEHLKTSFDYILPGNKTARQNLVYRRAPAWLRKIGITDQKPFHAMRKLAGSMVATTQGLYAARDFLGHASVRTTEEHYADFLKPITPVGVIG